RSHIDDTVKEFSLNKEQEKAFKILTHHAIHPDCDQLRMYLGGMGGIGKSQVIKSWTHFFKLRGESYKILALAPTGSAAAPLGGSTYHSALGINDKRSESVSSIAHVKESLRGVEYIFIDELSMLSCHDSVQ
ncbi:hypothetical protein HYDPIDRAFT_101094, partial [Hydnomerulius pinastri MD-312]